jgi:hypothetical protein
LLVVSRVVDGTFCADNTWHGMLFPRVLVEATPRLKQRLARSQVPSAFRL